MTTKLFLPGYAPVLLRLSISFVFLWFGINQLFNTKDFISYLPDVVLQTGYVQQLIFFNGIFELVFGVFLLIGLYTRLASFLLGVHLIGIIAGLGYTDIAMRDIGLMLATFSITLGGADQWTLDHRRKKL